MGIDPLTLTLGAAALSAATTVAGTVSGIAGAQAEGDAAMARANYRAAVARNNAALARAGAAAAERDTARADITAREVGFAGQRAVAQQDRQARQQIAEVIAGQGASGLTGGSQGQVRNTLRTLAAQDRFNIRQAAEADTAGARQNVIALEQEAINYENEARGMLADATASVAEGQYARKIASRQAIGTAIEGAGSLAGTFLSTASNPAVSSWLSKRGMRNDPALRPAYRAFGL